MPRTIDTTRLYLRPPVPTDASAIFAYASDPCATRYMVWPTAQTIDDTHDFLDDVAAGWDAGDDYCYVVVDRSSDILLGAAACRFGDHGAEIGYILARSAWGAGYATETATALVDRAWQMPDLYRIWATCDVDNLGSARVLEKTGLPFEARLARWSVCPNLAGSDGTPRDAWCYALTR